MVEGGHHGDEDFLVDRLVIIQAGLDAGGEVQEFDGPDRFVIILIGQISGVPAGVDAAQLVHNAFVTCALRPFTEALLIGLLFGHSMILLDSLLFALPLFPGIGDGGVLGGILDPDSLGLGHVLLLDVQPLGTERNLLRIGDLGNVFDLVGHHIFLRTARAAVNEGEIALTDTGAGYFEELFRAIRDVVRGIVGRIVVLVGIDPEDGEIAGMAGPHPIVGVAAEFADGGRRSAHETDVTEHPEHEQEILVAIE